MIFFPVTVTCPALPSPSNGEKQGCTGIATEDYGTVCRFSCNQGYDASGSEVRTCQENGEWSGELFSCQKGTYTDTLSRAPGGGEPLGIFGGGLQIGPPNPDPISDQNMQFQGTLF